MYMRDRLSLHSSVFVSVPIKTHLPKNLKRQEKGKKVRSHGLDCSFVKFALDYLFSYQMSLWGRNKKLLQNGDERDRSHPG